MELAQIAFNQILTMVLLMIIGVFCYKINMIDEPTNKKLSSFVLLLVNPIVIFLSYQREFESELMRGLMISLLLAILSYGISLAVTHVVFRNKGDETFGVEKYACVYSNSGLIGIPLVQGVFGLEGVFYLTAYLTVFNLLVWTHGVMVMSGQKDLTSIKKVFLSPPLLATILGLLAFLFRFQLPDTLANPLGMLGSTNTPLGMMVAGVSMAQCSIKDLMGRKRLVLTCVMRLLLIPGLVILAFSFIDAAPILTGTSLIAVACPVAANLILFAYRYEKDTQYATGLFVLSTMLSMVTIPLMLLLI